MKFSINDFFSKLVKKSLIENFILCAMSSNISLSRKMW